MPPDFAKPAIDMVQTGRTECCLWCGVTLPRSRADRRFCKPAHAAAFTKWRHGLKRLTNQIERRLKEIADYSGYPQFCDSQLAFSEVSKKLDFYSKLAQMRQAKAIRELDAQGQ